MSQRTIDMMHDIHDIVLYKLIFIGVDAIYVGGVEDVLYNKFNVTSSSPPVNPPDNTTSDYKCVVNTGGYYWRLSRCTDEHRVVCQSG